MKFYLDGTLYDNPNGWESLSERLFYEDGINGYLSEVSGSVDFYGGAYQYLLNLRNSALCNKVSVLITDNCADGDEVNIFEGFIFITDVEFNIVKCSATVEFVDNGFVSKISNNKEIKCYVGVNRSKNDVDISAFDTPQTNIALRNSSNGADITNAKGYRIFDTFKFLIAFMTDGTVNFVSDFFDPSGTGTDNAAKYTVLMSGQEIRTSGDHNPYVSFEDFYNDVSNIFNLAFSVEQISGTPTIRIEPKDYYRQSGEINYFEYPSDLTQTVPQEQLYAKVKFGCTNAIETFTYLQNIAFIGFQPEEYHLLGECNSSSVLDLTQTTLITDTNIIQDVLPSGTGNDAYDEDAFLVVLDSSNINQSTQKPAGLTYYYNEPINNLRVSEYWFGNIPNSIAVFLDPTANDFYANRVTTTQTVSGTIIPDVPDTFIFNNDTIAPAFDTGGNYNTANGRYTAAANNVYTLEANLLLSTVTTGINIGIVRYDSGGTAVDSKIIFNNVPYFGANIPPDAPFPISGIINITGSWTTYMDATDYIEVNIYGDAIMEIGSYFKTDFLGAVGQTYDETDIPIIQNNLEYSISCDTWQTIKSTPFKTFTIQHENGIVKGWLNEISRNIKTGEATVIINSKPNG